MGVTYPSRRFVYGTFHRPGKPKLPAPPWEKVAIEVLREYSANEIIGKVYVQVGGNWTPILLPAVENSDWYKWYKKLPAHFRNRAKAYYFDMDGSGPWRVLHFRTESDETGPYFAVAIQYVGS